MQLQNKFLNYKQQFKSLIPKATIHTQPQESNQISTNVLTGEVPTAPNPVQEPPEIIPATPANPSDSHTSLIYHGNLFLYLISRPPSFNFDKTSHGRIAVTS